jgi:hypothetical protein
MLARFDVTSNLCEQLMSSEQSEQSRPGSDPKQKLGPLPPEEWPDVEHLVTEDDTPVDIFSSKQQRLLVEPLYTSWDGPGNGRRFLAMSNIGLFYKRNVNTFERYNV